MGFFLSLSSIKDVDQFLLTIAHTVNFHFYNSTNLKTQLLGYFQTKNILLIMDSFEHLLDGVDLLSEILEAASQVKMLVTSREALNLPGEWRYDIKGLLYPVSDEIQDLESYSAIKLFVQRASQVRPAFMLATEKTHVLQICRLVEGLPLAIELAATWLTILSCQEIVSEINRNLDFLTTMQRTIPERHRSIRAVFDESWTLLSEDQKVMFASLSVFHGVFSREAAEAIVGASLNMLLALVNKSFLSVTDRGLYHCLPLLRQYGEDKLRENLEQQAIVHKQYASYFGNFLYASIPEILNDYHDQVLEIEANLNNIRYGWQWSVIQSDVDLIGKYAQGFWYLYNRQGWYLAGKNMMEDYKLAIAQVTAEQPDISTIQNVVGCLYTSLVEVLNLLGQRKEALQVCEEAIGWLPIDETLWHVQLYRQMGNIHRLDDQQEMAHQAYLQAEIILNKTLHANNDKAIWQTWIQLKLEEMWRLYWSGEWPELDELAQQLRSPIEHYASVNQQINYYNSLSAMFLQKNRYVVSDEFLRFWLTSLTLSLQSKNQSQIAWTQFGYGFGLLWHEDYEQAEQLLQSALALAEQNGDIVHQARCLTYLTLVYRRCEQIEKVAHYSAKSLMAATAAQMPEYMGTARGNQAWLAWRGQNLRQVEMHGLAALGYWQKLRYGHPSSAFQWTALWPLIGSAILQNKVDQAINYARLLIDPSQQRLPGNQTTALETAITMWESGEIEAARFQLQQACTLAGMFASRTKDVDRSIVEPITERELDVLRLLALGLPNRQIADQLCVAVSTVHSHIKSLYGKLDVHNRSQAILRAKDLKLI